MPKPIDPFKLIARNLADVRGRIAEAARRSGRSTTGIYLVGVTKYAQIDEAQALVDAGCFDLGESRPQELWHKADSIINPEVAWHLIGPLQRNKVRQTLRINPLIHSVDSWRLLQTIDGEAAVAGLVAPVLLEVNTSGETAKHGLKPEELPAFLEQLATLECTNVCGLMTMAGREGGLDEARRCFARLRELRNKLQPLCPQNVALDQLSMGMSGDYEAAIEEGATLVRIGSALFAGLKS